MDDHPWLDHPDFRWIMPQHIEDTLNVLCPLGHRLRKPYENELFSDLLMCDSCKRAYSKDEVMTDGAQGKAHIRTDAGKDRG